jgi:hypothetical protein
VTDRDLVLHALDQALEAQVQHLFDVLVQTSLHNGVTDTTRFRQGVVLALACHAAALDALRDL